MYCGFSIDLEGGLKQMIVSLKHGPSKFAPISLNPNNSTYLWMKLYPSITIPTFMLKSPSDFHLDVSHRGHMKRNFKKKKIAWREDEIAP